MACRKKKNPGVPAYPAVSGVPERRWLILLGLILVVAALLRVVYLIHLTGQSDFTHPVLDPQLNDYHARALLSGDWTPPPGAENPRIPDLPYGRPPGYPWLLACIYSLSDGSYLAPRIFQQALGLVSIVLVYLLGRRLAGPGSGLAAAALMAVYWIFIYFEGELNAPAAMVFTCLLLVLLLTRWAVRQRPGGLFMAGIMLGIAALLRPNVLLPGIALAAWIVWHVIRNRGGRLRRGLAMALCYLTGSLLVITPVIIRNYAVSGDFVLISYYGGVNAWIGNNPAAAGVSPEIPDIRELSGMRTWNCFNYPEMVRRMGLKSGRPDMSMAEASAYFYGRAFDFIRSSPADALKLTLKKAIFFWGPAEISGSKVIALERAQAPLLPYLPGFPLALALFAGGIAMMWRDRRNAPGAAYRMVPVLVFVTGYFFSVLPFFIAGRYRVPVIPFMLLAGGYALYRLGTLFARKEYRSFALWLTALLALFLLCHIPPLPWQPDAAVWHIQRAAAASDSGAHENAAHELHKALEIDPHNIRALRRLALSLDAMKRPEDAAAAWLNVIQQDPGDHAAYNNLGYLRLRRGDPEAAEKLYQRALDADPFFTPALNNLGNLYLDRGRIEDAITLYRRALEVNPADTDAWFNLGNAFYALRDPEKAEAFFRNAIALAPARRDIRNNLGLMLSRFKRYDAAEKEFRAILARDPEDTWALYHLANILGESGRLEEAAETYEKALAIAPDFEEARKNLKIVRRARQDDKAGADLQTGHGKDPR
jgi:tetratricopeptide (TPR) repeat protein